MADGQVSGQDSVLPAMRPPAAPPPHNEGKTTAAWVTTGLVTLGSIIITVAMIFGFVPGYVVGAVVLLAGLVVGRIMRAMGLGQPAEGSGRS